MGGIIWETIYFSLQLAVFQKITFLCFDRYSMILKTYTAVFTFITCGGDNTPYMYKSHIPSLMENTNNFIKSNENVFSLACKKKIVYRIIWNYRLPL